MKKYIFSSIYLVFILFLSTPVHADEIQKIKQNYVRAVLAEEAELTNILVDLPKETVVGDQLIVELNQRYPVGVEEINQLIDNLREDGAWPDIDYASLIAWQLITHPERIYLMCKQLYREGSPFYQSPKLAEAIHKSMNYWFKNKFEAMEQTKRGTIQRNWWYNEIGYPKAFSPAFILFEDRMSESQKAGAIEVMKASKIGTTGQNKVWLSRNVLVRGLLENDFELVKQARDSIVSEIIYGASGPRSEGIQYDYSYQLHGRQQQFGNYGTAYIGEMSFWSMVFDKTSIALEQSKLDILSMLVNEGFQRILWKGYMDVNGLGRQFFRQTQKHKALSVAFSAKALAAVDDKNKDKYNTLISDNFSPDSGTPNLQGMYHFWNSDQTIVRRPQWMASIRMSSNRTIGGEAGNGDNKKGYYMSDGTAYIYIDGSEYEDVFPVWDWRKLPGITAYETDSPLKLLTFAGYRSYGDFVGNVTDGRKGMTVMHLVRDRLSAIKSWIFTDNYMLCLGAGITVESDSVVTTAIDQRLKKADLLRLKGETWAKTDKTELANVKDARFYHHNTGYIVLQADKAYATDETRTASWEGVIGIYPKDMMETKGVVSLWFNHGSSPHDATYQYMVLPAASQQQVKSFDMKEIEVLSNTKEAQIVHLPKEKTIFVSAFSPIARKLPNAINFKCSQPGLYMIKYKSSKERPEVIFNDPTQALKSAEYEINSNKTRIYKATSTKNELFKIAIAGSNFIKFNADTTIQMMQQLQIPNLCIKSRHLPFNSTDDEIRSFRAKLLEAGIEAVSTGLIYMRKTSDVDQAFEYAKRIGVKLIIGTPNHELLPYVEQKVKAYNICYAIHIHGPDLALYPNAADVMKHIEGLDTRIGLCLDIGHDARAGFDPAEDLRKYHHRIFDIHIKDITAADKSGRTCEMGRGVLDIPKFVQTLRDVKYSGLCTFEFEKDLNDPLAGIAESVDYFKGVLDGTMPLSMHAQKSSADYLKPEYIKSILEKSTFWQLENPKRRVSNEWTNATFYAGVFAAWETTQNQKIYDALIDMGKTTEWMPHKRFFHADDYAISQTYIDLYRIERKPEMIRPTQDTINLFISKPYPGLGVEAIKWWWCDALFMGPPVLVKLGVTLNNPDFLKYNDQYFRESYDLLYDKKEHLFFRDLSYVIKGNKNPRYEANGKPVFWSRGNGWVMGGLARILKELPADYPQRPFYENLFKDMAERIISLQQPDGLWRASLLDPESYPGGETSSSGFFCYALAWGVNSGLLDGRKYRPVIEKCWIAINECVNEEGRVGWVQPIGSDPRKNLNADSWEMYGTGAFLLAGSEVIKLNK